MSEEASTLPAAAALTLRRRIRVGLARPANWLQLLRFGMVGASGYVVNLVVFAALTGALGTDHRVAATGAFLVAVTNNFWWNRHWTFGASDRAVGFQAPRFLAVSVGAFLFALLVLEILVNVAGIQEVLAQAAAIVAATPLNFLGNRLWSFRR
jgi:putative flippase GtrA